MSDPSPEIASSSAITERFRIVDLLGSGGSGAVYRAFDQQRQVDVALKLLHPHIERRAFEMKREFRTAVNVRHPNLVRLFELFVRGPECFLTMEFLEGVEPSSRVPDERLQELFVHATAALAELHRHGLVHCDVKPSNLVLARDRTVLLDFGLVTPVRDPSASQQLPAGTLAYLAPEVLEGARPAPARDVYGLGRTIHALFSGVPATDWQSWEPVPPLAGTPHRTLVEAMLEQRPEDRPTAEEVWADLGGRSEAQRTRMAPLIPRPAEEAVIQEAIEDSGPRWLSVRGSSGVGKTWLVERTLADGVDAVILRGTCHPAEQVPYPGLDSAADAILDIVRSEPPSEWPEIYGAAAALARMFPSFSALPPLGRPGDRPAAIAALRSSLERLAERRSTVLWIDDAQWLPPASQALLEALVREPHAPGVLLLTTERDEQRSTRRFFGLDPRVLELAPLPPGDALELVRQLMPAATADTIRRFTEDTDGNPYLITELAADAAGHYSGLESLIEARMASLGAEAMRCARRVALARRPLGFEELCDAHVDTQKTLDMLHDRRVVRVHTGPQGTGFTVWHDRLGQVLRDGLSAEEARSEHASLAASLIRRGTRRPGAIARHLLSAGTDPASAIPFLIEAADHARQAGAFPLQARLLGQILEVDPDREEVRAAFARALAASGRGVDASREFQVLADRTDDTGTAARWLAHAAEQLLYAGQLDQGREMVRRALRRIGEAMPAGSFSAFVYLFWVQLVQSIRGLHLQVRDSELASIDHARVDVLRKTAMAMAHYEGLIGAAVGARHLQAALASGEPGRAGAALAIHASQMATFKADAERSRRLLEQASAWSEAGGDAECRSIVALSRAAVGWLEGDQDAACAASDGLVQHVRTEHPAGRWLVDSAWMIRLAALRHAGRLDEVSRLLPQVLEEASAVGDPYLHAQMEIRYGPVRWLALGRPSEARRSIDQLLGSESAGYDQVASYATIGRMMCALYEDEPTRALAIYDDAWWALVRSMLLSTDFFAVLFASLELRALAAAGQRESRRWRKVLRRLVSRQDRHPMANAWVVAYTPQSTSAQAAAAFTGAGMHLHAALALQDTSRARHLGAVDPEGATRWLLPGRT